MAIDDFKLAYSNNTDKGPPLWKIKFARYFGRNETTLALIEAPNNAHYLVRSAGYPYGTWKLHHTKDYEAKNWNQMIDRIAGENNDLASLTRGLNALPIIECRADDPHEEFEERCEMERYMSREELADSYINEWREQLEASRPPTPPAKQPMKKSPLSKLSALFSRAAELPIERQEPAPKDFCRKTTHYHNHSKQHFLNLDVNRTLWYRHADRFFDKYSADITQDGVRDLITQVCNDFKVPFPKDTKLVPWHHFRKNGDYTPNTTIMRLRHMNGKVSKATVIHELAHHIDNTFNLESGAPAAGHGMRFKRIHMHLAHHYMDVPIEDILDNREILFSYGGKIDHDGEQAFTLTAQHIKGRDFTEGRTCDIEKLYEPSRGGLLIFV